MTDQELQNSIAYLEDQVARGDADREVIFDLADAYREAQRPGVAAELLDSYLAESGPDWDACRLCVESYREADRMSDAVRVLNRGATLYKDRAQFWTLRGLMLEEMGDWEAALTEYRIANRIAPHMAEAIYRRGVVLMHLKQYQAALEAFNETLRLRPRLVPALINAGLCYEALERTDEAIEAFNRTLTVDPKSAEAHLNLGALYGELGQMDASLEHCERALEIDPHSSHAAFNAGLAVLERDPDRAARYLRMAVSLDERNLGACHLLGAIAQRKGMWDTAVGLFRQVVEKDPERLDSLFAMGVCCSKADRPEDAIRTFKQLLELDPNNSDAWFYLGLSYDKQGDSRSAGEAYRKADACGSQTRRESP